MDRKALTDGTNKEYLLYADKNKTHKVVAYEVIGRGSNAIAYRGMADGKCCVIKEAFPETVYGRVFYVRDAYGKELELVVKDDIPQEEKEKLIEEEKKRIYRSVKRECDIVQKMFCDGNINSPYVYSAKTLCEYGKEGDYLYAVLDTREGKTLYKILKENGGRLVFDEAVEYFKKIFEVIRTLLKDQYCHADIKPENIWVQGKNENQAVVLIDLGSAFAYSEFQLPEQVSDEEYMEYAKKIQLFPGIGSSSEGYQSEQLVDFEAAKKVFLEAVYENRSVTKKAKKLIQTMNRISVMDDVYSALQTLFVMITGKLYLMDGSINVDSISKETGLEKLVVEYLFDMMHRREDGYRNLEEVENDVEILCNIYKRGVHPEILIDQLKKVTDMEQDIEELLLADVQ